MDDDRPLITVEFYGVPRRRAGREKATLRAHSVGELLERVAEMCPPLAASLAGATSGSSDCLLSINGTEFVTDRRRTLSDGDTVLVLSADLGG